jgi:alpha-L-arabinofuranosidase
MQKMLFTDNQGSRILPFTQNTANCYWSASLDTEAGKNDILLKVANNKDTPETVMLTLKGAGKIEQVGHSTTLTAASDAENSLADPTDVIPSEGTFVAKTDFQYLFPANSVTVLRIRMVK